MTSSTAHGVMAVNSWMLPPVVGYRTEVPHEDVNTLSTFNLANLTAKKKKTHVWGSAYKELITHPINSWSFKIKKKKKQKGERTHIEIVVATCYHQRPQAQPNHRT